MASNDAQEYNIATIRQLLLAAFTPEELRRFCYDRPTFRPVVNRFGPGYGHDDMVDELIIYCDTGLLFPEFLAELEQAKPRQYERFEPDLYAPDEAPTRAPGTPPSPPAESDRAEIQILLPGALPDFTEERREILCDILAAVFRVDRNEIRILTVQECSIRVFVEVPRDALGRLRSLSMADKFRLARQGVRNISGDEIEDLSVGGPGWWLFTLEQWLRKLQKRVRSQASGLSGFARAAIVLLLITVCGVSSVVGGPALWRVVDSYLATATPTPTGTPTPTPTGSPSPTYTLTPTSTPSATPTPTPCFFSYEVQVIGDPDSEVRVVLQIDSEKLLASETTIRGSGSFAIKVPCDYENRSGVLTITADGYASIQQPVEIDRGGLSEPIRLPTPTPILTVPVGIGTPVPQPLAAITVENVDEMVQLARWGKGTLNDLAYSPKEPLLAVASALGIYFYDTEAQTEVGFIDTGAWVNCVAFSPDGQTLASGSDANKVQLWRVENGELLQTLEGHTGKVRSVAFSPDGERLASGADDKTVRLWQVSDGSTLRTLSAHPDGVWSVVFSPDGRLLASAACGERDWRCLKGQIHLWRVSDGSKLQTIDAHQSNVNSLAFSPDGDLLASGAGSAEREDNTVRLWQVSDGTLVHTLAGHTDWVIGVAFSPDGETLASAADDGTVRLWQVSDGSRLRTLEGHEEPVRGAVFASDGASLASGSWDGTVRLWRVEDGSLVHTWQGFTSWIRTLAFSPDGEALASGSKDGLVRLQLAGDGALSRVLEGHDGGVNSVVFSQDGTLLASGADDDTVRLWRTDTAALLRTMEERMEDVNSVAFSPDGAMLASGSCSDINEGWQCIRGEVALWNVDDGALLQILEEHTSFVGSVAFSPDGTVLASGACGILKDGWDCVKGEIQLWQTSDWNLQRVLDKHTSWITSLAFAPGGDMLASGSEDDTARLWRVSDGALLQTVDGHRDNVNAVAFSPAGTLLASGASDDTIWLSRVEDGARLRLLEGHTGNVTSVAFSPDGTLLASASDDGTIRLWGVLESGGTPTRSRPADGMVMVYVASGTFQMGATSDEIQTTLTECEKLYDAGVCEQILDEGPSHAVTVGGFYIDQTEVTNAQYALCVAAGDCTASIYKDNPRYNGDEYPVVGIKWDDAAAYCTWAGGRLPTEAEWEYAARGSGRYVFPWGNEFDGLKLNYCDANCPEDWNQEEYDDGHPLTAPVGSFPAGRSWCGALDMAGNISEWVWDWYGPYSSVSQTNPTGPEDGTLKVVRGGGWNHDRIAVRSVNRIYPLPTERVGYIGFRCVVSAWQ